MAWHWAHEAAECDPWSEPESQWHIGWKRHFEQLGATTEVVMGNHRADVVMPSGQVIELQSNYLSATDIAERERFYGTRMAWIYRCHWSDRLHFGRRGFWWKHGSKAMATHRQSIWWDMGAGRDLVKVRISAVHQQDQFGLDGGVRILGKIVDTRAIRLEPTG